MRHDGTSELFAYWNRLRGTRAAPERREIAPASIRKYLADTFIVQAIGPGEPRFRLAGTRICSIYGKELRNMSFASLWQTKDKSNIARLIKNSMTNKSVVQMNYEGKSTRGRKALFELILLPLASEANELHLMGMIISLGRPFWLESDAIVESRIQSISIIDPRHPARSQLGDSVVTAPEKTGSMALPATRTIISRKVRHLRVFDGGKIID
ncbi:PAS domain-containing protein [Phyllobacterium sp. LjRoot231]|uniref:PAS domain-containing protein n=1 Tax=Phyllobacterium sp. LjRoot231 TaxID=3342289 RepID=UPI003ECEE693